MLTLFSWTYMLEIKLEVTIQFSYSSCTIYYLSVPPAYKPIIILAAQCVFVWVHLAVLDLVCFLIRTVGTCDT